MLGGLLASIVGGYFIGTGINVVLQGGGFFQYHSPQARRQFKQTYGKEIKENISKIEWTDEDLDTHWYE